MAVTRQQVAELYVTTFNRAPDAAGLDYWVNTSGLTIEGIAQSFFDQPETQALYPAGNTNTAFVTSIYTNLFNRTPDAAGLAYWVAELDNSTMTRSVMIEAMKNGATGTDATIVANKATVGLAFADAGLDGTDFSLASVTEVASTVTAANVEVATLAYDAAVAAAEAIANNPNSTIAELNAANAAAAAAAEAVAAAETANATEVAAEAAAAAAAAEAADVAAYDAAVVAYNAAVTTAADSKLAAEAAATDVSTIELATASLTAAKTAETDAMAVVTAADAVVTAAAATDATTDDDAAAVIAADAATAATAASAMVATAQVIVDNATEQTFTIAAASSGVTEGNAIVFTVTADHARDVDTTINYQIQGVAAAGGTATPVADLGILNGTVTILAGSKTATITLTPTNDQVTEGYEGFQVNLLNSSFATTASSAVVVIQDPENAGQTFTLTTGVDGAPTFTGGAGDDVYTAVVSYNTQSASYQDNATTSNTWSALDNLDGAAGTDTLNINDISVAGEDGINLAMGTIKNIETINIQSAQSIGATAAGASAVDMSGLVGLETVNITKAINANVKVANTTDVNVSGVTGQTTTTGGENVTVAQDMNATAGSGIQVNTAKNVTITATDSVAAANGINVGAAAATAATGTVTINATGATLVGNDGAVGLDAITVFGGTSVNITQVAAASYGDAASTNAGADDIVTQGAVTVNTTNNTTDITITQDTARAAVNAAFTTGGVTETASVKFGALKANDKLTIETTSNNAIDATEFTITAKVDMTAAEVAAAFANLVNEAAKGTLPAGDTQGTQAYTKAIYTGKEALWTTGAANGDTVVFTSTTANGTATDIDFYLTNTSTNSVAPIVTTTQGKANDATKVGGVTGIVAGVVTVAAGTTAEALTEVTIDSYGAGSAITGTAAALATINLSNGGAFTVSDTANTVTLNLQNTTGAVTFTAQPVTLNVKSIGNNTGGVVAAATTTTLNVSGTGTLTSAGSLAAVETITVTETAGLNLTGATLTALKSVTTTGTSGTVTASISGTQATYTGGAGVDNVTVSNAGTAITKAIDLGAGNDKLTLTGAPVVVPTSTLAAGEGTDTLSMSAASAAALDGDTTFSSKLTSFERLELTGASGGETIDVEKLGFTSYVTLAGTAGATAIANLANNANLIVNANVTTSVTASIKDDTTGTEDVLNVTYSKDGILAAADLIATNVETVNLTVTDTDATNGVSVHTMNFDSAKATKLDIGGNAGLTLTLDVNTVKLATIDASDMTAGPLSVTANGAVVMTITGGAGADVLTASATKADIINGGAGNDTITAGFNGAKLTGGLGNDLFVVGATSAVGNTEANTYSYIQDFQAGDKIQLAYFDTDTDGLGTNATGVANSFTKLAANLDESTASFSNFVTAAFQEMTAEGQAIWFMYGGDSYIVMDNNVASNSYVVQTTGFVSGEDLIVRVENVDLTGVSFNSDYGTIEIA